MTVGNEAGRRYDPWGGPQEQRGEMMLSGGSRCIVLVLWVSWSHVAAFHALPHICAPPMPHRATSMLTTPVPPDLIDERLERLRNALSMPDESSTDEPSATKPPNYDSDTPTTNDYLTNERRDKLAWAFALFDEDGDGVVSMTEIGNVMRGFGEYLPEEELTALLRRFDVDNGGTLDFDEFCQLADQRRTVEGYTDEVIRRAINSAFPKAERVARVDELSQPHAINGLDAFFDFFECTAGLTP